jgi:CRISPR-associated endonuclease/helicase Cas3
MQNLDINSFELYFRTLWEFEPFAWQKQLAKRVLENADHPWPEVIALPTASGKTACLDIAVFSLAAQAEKLERREPVTAPRRIFFVVDRRIIVDEAFERARKLSSRLRDADGGILKDIADRLRMIGRTSIPLECHELRGGMYRSDAWAKSPLQPAIIASTVDQIGSRLLFRAYGRSHKAWPIQAGLTANDSIILLDEAHCAVPFMETVRSISKYRTWAEAPLSSPFYTVVMSATPPPGMNDIFIDTSSEPTDIRHPLGKRQSASKRACLQIVQKAKGKDAELEMAKALAAAAEDLVEDRNFALVVFANRVCTARETFKILDSRHSGDVVLLTGRMRAFDKDDVVKNKLALLSANASENRILQRPMFVVATQTLEVGADLDFDAMVTECASLDALQQRFGRLNRMGREIEAGAGILVRADQASIEADDPVYGTAIGKTWEWLNLQADNDRTVDFGIISLKEKILAAGDFPDLNAPVCHAPVMLPAHVDCWVQTSPEPMPSPDVSIFLHGPAHAVADVFVCWRADLNLSDEENIAKSLDILTLCPPAAAECLPVPIWGMKSWLSGEVGFSLGSDVEGENPANNKNEDKENTLSAGRCGIRWRNRDEADVLNTPNQMRPGDVVVIPAAESGWEALGDLARFGEHDPILDYGDRAFAQTRGKSFLRLNPEVIDQWPPFDTKTLFLKIANEATNRWDNDPDGLIEECADILKMTTTDENAPEWLKQSALSLLSDPSLRRLMMLHPFGGLILRGTRRIPNSSEALDVFTDEDDASASGTFDVPLHNHLQGVRNKAEIFVAGCALPQSLQEAVVKAAGLHDVGKIDPRFQALLRGGNPWLIGTEPLAKSERLPQSRLEYLKAQRDSGLPKGARHELLSVRLVESDRSILLPEQNLAELTLHLVASHHGYCRPFAPVVMDEKPVVAKIKIDEHILSASSDTGLEKIDSGVAERFWRLTRKYGWWSLAWLESLTRLADHRQSEMEERESRGGK